MYEINYLIKFVTINEILTRDSHRDENSRHKHSNTFKPGNWSR